MMLAHTGDDDDLVFDPSTMKVSPAQLPVILHLLSYSLVSQVARYTPDPAHTLKRPGLGYGLRELLAHTLLLDFCYRVRHCICNQKKTGKLFEQGSNDCGCSTSQTQSCEDGDEVAELDAELEKSGEDAEVPRQCKHGFGVRDIVGCREAHGAARQRLEVTSSSTGESTFSSNAWYLPT